ncbi:hypothetical protein [Acinetobacter stercoris]|uniref:Uncharacterized protein n=1 Tax=Acinetobacter stercoris TaxID=2126983 RepID=A0A2U3N3U6_9GAMM|nr:hypothetical protein [Acinetobacter stercoris]SPL72294.1 hypothetical protein KPC_3472 [Acinetobacter stercoris]
MRDRFYLACFRDNVGSNVGFNCHNLQGYHTDLDKAHVCTLKEAQYHFDHAREYDQPLSADHVDALAIWKVDHQYIPNKTQISGDEYRYVAFQKNKYDGNDVFWMNKFTYPTTDFSRATILNEELALAFLNSESGFIVIPFSLANQAKRRTFDFNKINKRTMIQGAGLKISTEIKKFRRRKKNPKTRFNCPSCGKISWQFNPYDFLGCKDIRCKEWKGHFTDIDFEIDQGGGI